MDQKNWLNNPLMAILIAILLISGVAYIGVLTSNQIKEGRYIGRPDTERDTITISGEGRVTAVPDIGQVTVTIVTEDKDAAQAQETNVSKFNNLIAAIKAEGVEDKDLKTSNYSVNPRYNYTEEGRELVGYEVRQSLDIKIRDLDNSGAIIKVAGDSGANQVSGLSFTIDDPEEYRQEARQEALENAKQKAEELAGLMGVSLGKIVSFTESADGGYIPTPVYRDLAFAEQSAMGGAEPSIEAGSEEVSVTATIVYEIY